MDVPPPLTPCSSSSSSYGEGGDVKPLKKLGEEIRVVARVRPLNDRETNPDFIKPTTGMRCWRILRDHNAITQTLNDGITPVHEKISGRNIFAFDKIFNEQSQTKEVYEFAGREIVQDCLAGRNGSIFAYGQTSSGKTYTMQGSTSIARNKGGEQAGFVHLAAADLFEQITKSQDRDYRVFVSVIEVYNEEARDLLVDKKEKNILRIREDAKKGIFVNALRKKAASLKELLGILSLGEKNRIVAKTTLNKRSSRSHLIFSIMLESKQTRNKKPPRNSHDVRRQRKIAELEISQVSTLNLVDLAGSESVRHRSEHSNENRRKEGGSINKSLLTLSRVISALGQQQSSSHRHIGYRDSKLTRVLQPSLSGNAKLAFVCCITISGLFLEETKSTLQFAQRIKHVKTASKINVKAGDKSEIIKRMQEELDDARQSLVHSMDKINDLENENQSLKSTIKFLTGDRDRVMKKVKSYERLLKEKEKVKKQSSAIYDSNNNIFSSGDIKGLNEANNDLKNQVGFLSAVVEKLQGKNKNDDVDQSMIFGMPANIRADSTSAIISEVTEPTRYGTHIDNFSHIYTNFVSEEETSVSSLLSKVDDQVGHSNTNVIIS